ncbi:MAG: VWA domain-containing protein [Polyangiaceae bacterium]|nr:VWA domain-containing protein [Polyangiaceae bacterium]MCW5792254.1 VWA domain-containing protein [Polyangiaceae bacterium]
MSFLIAAALAMGLLVVAPLVAHLLRRGRAEEREFPAAHLVPLASPVARQRTRLEDRALFGIRASIILLLALLGATPFISCSRLGLTRPSGASVALAIVLDDSSSMRARTAEGQPRFTLALAGAEELLDSTREGDAVALVAAGAPARLVLAATTDIALVRETLSQLQVSDRDTDLSGAVQLARSALGQLPHTDKRVLLLSDLAGAPIPEGEIPVAAPLPALAEARPDCAVIAAVVRGANVEVQVACADAASARGRQLSLRPATAALGPSPKPRADAKASEPVPLTEAAGVQSLALPTPSDPLSWEAALSGADSIPENDAAPVSPRAAATSVVVVTDASRDGSATGGPPLVERALAALEAGITVQPRSLVPDEAAALEGVQLLILDDPPGLAPEARAAVRAWLERGRTAVLFTGEVAASAQLASKLEPFLASSRWEPADVAGLDLTSVTWLSDSSGLDRLAPVGRSVLEGSLLPSTQIVARWSDGRPFITRRDVGRGKAYAVGLPVSAAASDLALCPGFLALLQELLTQAERGGGPARTRAGVTWVFSAPPQVSGPDGELSQDASSTDGAARLTPGRAGRYRVSIDGGESYRVVELSAEEVLTAPGALDQPSLTSAEGAQRARIDVSPHVALVLLGLLALELVMRLFGRLRAGPERRARRRSDAAA